MKPRATSSRQSPEIGKRARAPRANFVARRADGSPLPVLAAEHLQNIKRAREHPDMDPYRDQLDKILSQEVLDQSDVRLVRHAARHPEFAVATKNSLVAAADLHDAARTAKLPRQRSSTRRG